MDSALNWNAMVKSRLEMELEPRKLCTTSGESSAWWLGDHLQRPKTQFTRDNQVQGKSVSV